MFPNLEDFVLGQQTSELYVLENFCCYYNARNCCCGTRIRNIGLSKIWLRAWGVYCPVRQKCMANSPLPFNAGRGRGGTTPKLISHDQRDT
jgi:hypothetical protein